MICASLFSSGPVKYQVNRADEQVEVNSTLRNYFIFITGEYGVETYLELFSEDNFDAFCLAYMFTYRDFEGGTLGLAWTGDLQNAGGVCEKNGVSTVCPLL